MSTAPAPKGREREFGLDELFLSTTDGKGHISSGNEVFTPVGGYPADALLGRPHPPSGDAARSSR